MRFGRDFGLGVFTMGKRLRMAYFLVRLITEITERDPSLTHEKILLIGTPNANDILQIGDTRKEVKQRGW